MFTLVKEKCEFFRVKRGQNAEELESVLSTPVKDMFCGEILTVRTGLEIYVARPGDTFSSVAALFSVDEDGLTRLNGAGVVYPTRRIFVPRT